METAGPLKPDSTSFKFRMPAVNIPRYTNLKTILICLQLYLVETKIVNGIKKEIPVDQDDDVGPISCLLQLFFQTIRVWLNNSLIYEHNHLRFFCTYLEQLLFLNKNATR